MITEATDKKNGTRDQKGRGKNGRPNLLEDEEYQKLGHYDFSMFTKEDRAMYKTILEAEPYDWKLMKFFHEQKREATRMKKQDERHRSRTRVEDIMDVYPDRSISDYEMFDRDFMENLRDEMKDRVSDVAFNRAIKHCVCGYSKSEIARIEGKCFSSIYDSIEQTKSEMKEVLNKLFSEEQKNGEGGEGYDTVSEDY